MSAVNDTEAKTEVNPANEAVTEQQGDTASEVNADSADTNESTLLDKSDDSTSTQTDEAKPDSRGTSPTLSRASKFN